MKTFKLYAHKLATKNDLASAFNAINVVERIGAYLASLYNGEFKYSGSGEECVQYSDTLVINVSDSCARQIEKEYPFISETSESKYP